MLTKVEISPLTQTNNYLINNRNYLKLYRKFQQQASDYIIISIIISFV